MASPAGFSDGASKAGLQSSTSSSSDSTMAGKLQNATSLTIKVLQDITDDFSEERKIGQGAYGKVYVGTLENGQEIAVKVLYNNMPGSDDEQLFQHEFENLMRLEHHNIIRLVGYCYETHHQPMEYLGKTIFAEKTYRALCFEYMQNGSLQKHISEECDGLDWQTRYKIIKGTCEGLKHLHEGLEKPIYHLDLKPDNILLDKNMLPKLADFGLSKLFGDEQTRITQTPIGTIGYLPMEYLHGNVVSNKLDIFSLGVIMTKIIAGPRGNSRSAEMPRQEFIDLVHVNWKSRLQATLSLSQPLEEICQQVNICTEIALSCMENDRHKRPSILEVIDKLNRTETVIDKALSWLGSERSWMTRDLVRVKAIKRSEAFPGAETCNKFPVLVLVTGAPWRGAEEMPRAGVDVVLVVDVNMAMVLQWRLEIIKQALMIVIDKLGPNDRLSIVSEEDNAHCIMKLTFMSDQGRDVARLRVNRLAGSHGHRIIASLLEADKILRGREIGDSRVGSIMLVSDSHDTWIRNNYNKEINFEFPAYTFGLGEQHDPEVMKYIADMSAHGTYSFVHYDISEMKGAFELLIAGLTKVVATSVKVTLRAPDGVAISTIYSGGYNNCVNYDKQSGEVDIDNVFAGERKYIMVYLTLPTAAGEGYKKLLTVGGCYHSFVARRQLADMDAFVLRPRSAPCSPEKLAVHPEVAAELLRLRLRAGVLSVERKPEAIEQLWMHVKFTEEARRAPRETISEFELDIAEIKRSITHVKWPAYMISWLTCHGRQRPTTKGARCISAAFTVPGQHPDAKDEDDD